MEECIICFEEKDNFRFYSCTHKVCDTCYLKINQCPLCQATKLIDVIVLQPVNRPDNTRTIYTTYILIKCVFVFLTFTLLTLYLYRE